MYSYTRKPSAPVGIYITYVVQFHDVSLQFSRRIFHHYSSVFLLFQRRPTSPPSLSSCVRFRDGAPLCARRQIGNIFSRNIAAVPASTHRNIWGDNGISGRTGSLLNIRPLRTWAHQLHLHLPPCQPSEPVTKWLVVMLLLRDNEPRNCPNTFPDQLILLPFRSMLIHLSEEAFENHCMNINIWITINYGQYLRIIKCHRISLHDRYTESIVPGIIRR